MRRCLFALLLVPPSQIEVIAAAELTMVATVGVAYGEGPSIAH